MNLWGVAAAPTSENIMEWRANLKGPVGTFYEGGVWHLKLTFPPKYPVDPPAVKLFSKLPCHPNVLNDQDICLDLLEGTRSEGKGWSSAQSAASILLQLQSFLFVLNENAYKHLVNQAEIERAKIAANEFEDQSVGHFGKSNPWPKFQDEKDFRVEKTFIESVRSEIRCQHSRVGWEENPIGFLSSVTRNFRNGQINEISISKEMVCLRTFINEHVNQDFDNTKFKYWMPVYFGNLEEKHTGQFLLLFKHAVSMMSCKSTRKFNELQLVEFIPRILKTILVELIQSVKQVSLREIRTLFQLVRIQIMCQQEFPQFREAIESKLQDFIENPDKRLKKYTANLADIQIFSIICKNYDVEKFKTVQNEEKMDRNVLWLLKKIPEIEKENCPVSKADRVDISFNLSKTGGILTMLITYLRKMTGDDGFVTQFDANCGRCPIAEIKLQEQVKRIMDINSFDGYNREVGLPLESIDQINENLIKAIHNSLRKGYHGSCDVMNALPDSTLMVQQFNNVRTAFILDNKEKLQLNEDGFMEKLFLRWPHLKVLSKSLFQTDQPRLKKLIFGYLCFAKNELQDLEYFNKTLFDQDELSQTKSNSPLQLSFGELTWKDIYLTTEFMNQLLTINETTDLKHFYAVLDALQDHLKILVIPQMQVDKLKQGYFFITQVLTRCKNVKHLHLRSFTNNIKSNKKFNTSLVKGLNNLFGKEDVVSLETLTLHDFNGALSTFLDWTKFFSERDVKIITFGLQNCDISSQGEKLLSDFLINLRLLKVCVMDNVGFTNSKVLADTLIRCRSLSKVWLGLQRKELVNLGNFIQSFSILPNLEVIWIDFGPYKNHDNNDFLRFKSGFAQSRTGGGTPNANVAENLSKLFEITTRLREFYIFNNDYILTNPENFLQTLMSNNTVETVQIENIVSVVVNSQEIAKILSVNNHLKGALKNFKITSTAPNGNFFAGSYISKRKMFEIVDQLRGSNNSKDQNSKEDYSNRNWLQIETLVLGNYQEWNETNGSRNGLFNKDQNSTSNPKHVNESSFLNFVKDNKKLTKFNLTINARDMRQFFSMLSKAITQQELFSNLKTLTVSCPSLTNKTLHSLGTTNESFQDFFANLNKLQHLEDLDLSHSQLGVGGAKYLSQALKENKSIKHLNLFGNSINVSGCQFIAEALRVNTTIVFLDLGMNLIKGKGLKQLKTALIENTQNNLHILSIRQNHIRIETLLNFIQAVKVEKQTKLTHLQVKNNKMNSIHTNELMEYVDSLQTDLQLDIGLKCKVMDDSMLPLTVYMHWLPQNITEATIRDILVQNKVGVVTEVRIFEKWGRDTTDVVKRNKWMNNQAQVTFANENSVQRCISLNSKNAIIHPNWKYKFLRVGAEVD